MELCAVCAIGRIPYCLENKGTREGPSTPVSPGLFFISVHDMLGSRTEQEFPRRRKCPTRVGAGFFVCVSS